MRSLLAGSYERVFRTLIEGCQHGNPAMKSGALAALDSFLKEMSPYIVAKGRNNSEAKTLFRFLFLEAQRLIEETVRTDD